MHLQRNRQIDPLDREVNFLLFFLLKCVCTVLTVPGSAKQKIVSVHTTHTHTGRVIQAPDDATLLPPAAAATVSLEKLALRRFFTSLLTLAAVPRKSDVVHKTES